MVIIMGIIFFFSSWTTLGLVQWWWTKRNLVRRLEHHVEHHELEPSKAENICKEGCFGCALPICTMVVGPFYGKMIKQDLLKKRISFPIPQDKTNKRLSRFEKAQQRMLQRKEEQILLSQVDELLRK